MKIKMKVTKTDSEKVYISLLSATIGCFGIVLGFATSIDAALFGIGGVLMCTFGYIAFENRKYQTWEDVEIDGDIMDYIKTIPRDSGNRG